MKRNNVLGIEWGEFEQQILTPEEIAECDARAAIINELIKARKERGITQQQLEKMSGVAQPVIARMETGKSNPQIDTLLKVLGALGKTIQIVPIPEQKPQV